MLHIFTSKDPSCPVFLSHLLIGEQKRLLVQELNMTWRAKRAKTMRQKMVRVMTSASCFTECSRALMIVFNPAEVKKRYFTGI
jgi:hypothetical protein